MSSGESYQRLTSYLARRVQIAAALLCVALSVLVVRLWYLQVLQGERYRIKSENNRLRTVYIPPPRGKIVDRHGEVLVTNRPAFNVELIPEDTKSPRETALEVARITNEPPEEVLARMNDVTRRRRFEPRVLLKDVSRDVVARVAARRFELPGVVINVEPAREYLNQDLAAHVLGYIREVTGDQLKSDEFARYRPGDMVGQFGIEARYENLLQGERGVAKVIVDAAGNRLGESTFQEEQAGSDVTLTLDARTQRAADKALEKQDGAIVALEVHSGEILALSSSPRFDPNEFARGIKPARWAALVSGPERPLMNRALQGAYPPGSVFKLVVAAAALAEGVIGPEERINCPGFLPFGGRNFGCHKRTGHGPVNLREAMVQSCDVWFYTVGNRLDVDRIHDYAKRFGLGLISGLGLSEESRGIVPSRAWKEQYFKAPEQKRWFPGETLSVAIGQGAMTSTPMQMARAMAALVNGGFLTRPHIVRRVTSRSGAILEDYDPRDAMHEPIGVEPKILERVKETLVGVVNDPKGTGHRSKLPPEFQIMVGGKTGTSQVVSGEFHRPGTKFEDHAWFVGFAPAEKPEIVVAALAEHAGHGGAAAAPLVRQVLEAYFADRKVVAAAEAKPSTSSKPSTAEIVRPTEPEDVD
jgi:penicillin-binding protein 2